MAHGPRLQIVFHLMVDHDGLGHLFDVKVLVREHYLLFQVVGEGASWGFGWLRA